MPGDPVVIRVDVRERSFMAPEVIFNGSRIHGLMAKAASGSWLPSAEWIG